MSMRKKMRLRGTPINQSKMGIVVLVVVGIARNRFLVTGSRTDQCRRDGRRCRFRRCHAGPPWSHRRLHFNGHGPFIETTPASGDLLKGVKR